MLHTPPGLKGVLFRVWTCNFFFSSWHSLSAIYKFYLWSTDQKKDGGRTLHIILELQIAFFIYRIWLFAEFISMCTLRHMNESVFTSLSNARDIVCAPLYRLGRYLMEKHWVHMMPRDNCGLYNCPWNTCSMCMIIFILHHIKEDITEKKAIFFPIKYHAVLIITVNSLPIDV